MGLGRQAPEPCSPEHGSGRQHHFPRLTNYPESRQESLFYGFKNEHCVHPRYLCTCKTTEALSAIVR